MKKCITGIAVIMFLAASSNLAYSNLQENAQQSPSLIEEASALPQPVDNVAMTIEGGLLYVTSSRSKEVSGPGAPQPPSEEEVTASCSSGYRIISCTGSIACSNPNDCKYYGSEWKPNDAIRQYTLCTASAHIYAVSWFVQAKAICEEAGGGEQTGGGRTNPPEVLEAN